MKLEQEIARWLVTQLGYNAAADATLSSNCRGNLKGLWEFLITNYKTADTKRHIQHVLARHKREQEAALRAPQEQREAEQRRQRLRQLQKRNAELGQTLEALQTRTESRVQEAADQVCEQSLAQHVLQDIQAQTLLLHAFVQRGQQLLPQLQSLLSQLRQSLEAIKARCVRNTGSAQVQEELLQQLASLSSSIKEGLEQAMQYAVEQQQYIPGGGSDVDLVHNPDQQLMLSQGGAGQPPSEDMAEAVQQLLRLCRLLQAYRLPDDLTPPVADLLQHPPGLVWDSCAQLAHQNLQELTAQLDEAERHMLAPLHWGGAGVGAGVGSGDRYQALAWKPDQQQQQGQIVPTSAYGGCGGADAISTHTNSSSHKSSKHQLPWASGLNISSSSYSAAAMQDAAGMSLPPEVRVKMRLKSHMQLHVRTEQTRRRARAAQQELESLLGSTPILQTALLGLSAPAGVGGGVAGGGSSDVGGPGLSQEAELAQLFLTMAQERAAIELLRQFEQLYSQQLSELLEIKEHTEEKVLQVRGQMADDYELNHLLHLMAEDTLQLEHALKSHQQHMLMLLSTQLLPCGAAAAEAAQSAVGRQQQEVKGAGKLPLLDLAAPQRLGAVVAAAAGQQEAAAAGSSSSSQTNPVLSKPTVLRLQAAGRQLLLTGRATTGPKPLRGATSAAEHASGSPGAAAMLAGQDVLLSAAVGVGGDSSSGSHRRFADSAAVAALKDAAVVDPVAPLRCPAALMLDIAEQCREARQLQQQLEVLSGSSMAVSASITAATNQEEQLQAKVGKLHQHDRQEVVPHLQALLDECQAAQTFTRDQLATDQKQLWEMPAMHLAPHRAYQGKNCSQWLAEIQHLGAQIKDLSSGHAPHHRG